MDKYEVWGLSISTNPRSKFKLKLKVTKGKKTELMFSRNETFPATAGRGAPASGVFIINSAIQILRKVDFLRSSVRSKVIVKVKSKI